MCYQSPWGEYIQEKMLWLVDELGFDGLGIDGPYHGLPCLETAHKHVTPESVKYLNWDWERQFYSEMAKKGVLVTSPGDTPESFLLGVGRSPGGYTEEYHGNSVLPSENNPVSYEHAGVTTGRRAYPGPRTKAIYERWMNFFKTYRTTLLGETVHLARPNGKDVDGVMHVRPGANPPALVVLFNPTGKEKTVVFSLPLFLAGFGPDPSALISKAERISLDSRGCCAVEFTIKPFEVAYYRIDRKGAVAQ